MIDPQAIAAALDSVRDPSTGQGLFTSGRANGRQTDGTLDAVIEVGGLDSAQRENTEHAVRAALASLPGVEQVRILLTAERVAGPKLIAVASGKGGVG